MNNAGQFPGPGYAAVNDLGWRLSEPAWNDGRYESTLVSPDGQRTPMTGFAGDALNNQGVVVGSIRNAQNQQVSAVFRDGLVQALSSGDPSLTTGEARGINDAGDIVGRFGNYGASHPFLMHNGAMTVIPSVNGEFWGINASGDAVGQMIVGSTFGNPNGTHALLFRNGSAIDLNTFLPADSSMTLLNAYGINDAGQIVGDASLRIDSTHYRLGAYFLSPSGLPMPAVAQTPIPEPGAVATLALGGAGAWLLHRRRMRRG